MRSEDNLGDHSRVPRQEQIRWVVEDYVLRRESGEMVSVDSLIAAHPDLMPQLAEDLRKLSCTTEPRRFQTETVDSPRDSLSDGDEEETPKRMGPYEIRDSLGQGVFGRTYLAYDARLKRQVVLKVPSRRLLDSGVSVKALLEEARDVARLDHPRLITVREMQQESEPPYVVQDYIDGCNLSEWVKGKPPTLEVRVRVLMEITDAVRFAHQSGFVHRHLKPSNVLIDREGHAHVADFGLVARQSGHNIPDSTVARRAIEGESAVSLACASGCGGSDVAQEKFAGEIRGMPLYMSPEQARVETHRTDHRTDIWSLGVILYELLTGRCPFGGRTQVELCAEIQTLDPLPPRQLDSHLPSELQRICLKCLEKRPTDRYESTEALLDDLRKWNDAAPTLRVAASPAKPRDDVSSPVRIVPKGLRSFDETDAEFFLQLLPGPRDREGLPECIRFWRTCIERIDPDETFSVGVIYGPSGCGKTSLVKAGLIPQLASRVRTVYVEANPHDTETRILNGLTKQVPGSDHHASLVDAVRSLREPSDPRRKVLIVIDQFEQWLHARQSRHHIPRDEGGATNDLVAALRHCDGRNVQCIVVVRDDFWLAVSRFMRELEVPLLEGQNSELVDLFGTHHAREVLQSFGRAYGRWDGADSRVGGQQRAFIDLSVEGLAEEGKVACVRLALFADVMKDKPWIPASLLQMGGVEGVGLMFLEQTFRNSTAPPKHRFHQQAARAVLKALLPESGSMIKGHTRSHEELLEASGYAQRPHDFDDLIHILDREIRLITPTDREAIAAETDSESSAEPTACRSYQLTHDYLVPALQEWLTRKQKESRRGRAELKLAERTADWFAKAEARRLPSWWEYLSIRLLTRTRTWNAAQRQMMCRADRWHLLRAACLAIVVLSIGYAAYEMHGSFRAAAWVNSLAHAKEEAVPRLVAQAQDYQRWARPHLEARRRQPTTVNPLREQLHASLALVASDDSELPWLVEQLLQADVSYLPLIREALGPYQSRIEDDLWKILRDPTRPPAVRFRAGIALAGYVPESERWKAEDCRFLVHQLVSANPEHQTRLREYLRPIAFRLLNDLEDAFVDSRFGQRGQLGAAEAMAEFAGGDIPRLCQLLIEATVEQYQILYPLIADAHRTAAKNVLLPIVDQQPANDLGTLERVALGKRRAVAAITALRLGMRDEIFNALRVDDDPEALSQFIHHCRQRQVTASELADCLYRADASRKSKSDNDRKPEDRVLFGLLLALGEFRPEDLSEAERGKLIPQLLEWYAGDPSSAIHGASGWLLRHWGYAEQSREIDDTPVHFNLAREWFTWKVNVQDSPDESPRAVYLTFVVFPAGRYEIGSPEEEPHRYPEREIRRVVHITRPFAILDRDIVGAEVHAFGVPLREVSLGETPQLTNGLNWYDAVRFCRWLGEQNGLSEHEQPYSNPQSLDPAQYPPDPDPRARKAPRDWPLHLDRTGFRLPTEAEWEIVCRGGMRTSYGFGGDNSLLESYARMGEISQSMGYVPRQKRPNLRGVFDMNGNVIEWCHDWFHEILLNTEVEDPTGPLQGVGRMTRGSPWAERGVCRSAFRPSDNPLSADPWHGFRVAVTLP